MHPPCGVLQAPTAERVRIRDESTFAFIPQPDEEGKPIRVSGADDMLAASRTLALALVNSGQLDQELATLARLGDENPGLWGDRQRLLILVNSYGQAKAVAQEIAQQRRNPDEVLYLTQPGADEDDLFGLARVLQRGDVEQFAWTSGKILVAPLGAIGRAYNILNPGGEAHAAHAAFGAIYFLVRPMPHPYDVQALAGELNAYALAACADPDFPAWAYARLEDQRKAFRNLAREYWQRAEMRHGYGSLNARERRDLAATTFGRIVQAMGRLVRGGVPFHAYFVDASWAPKSADAAPGTPHDAALDSGTDSLLTEIVQLFVDYDESPIGTSLYEPFSGLLDFANFYPDRKDS
jgi:hypothetical protein